LLLQGKEWTIIAQMILPVFLPHLGCSEKCIYCDQQFITDLRDTDLSAVIAKTLSAHEGPYEVGLFGGNMFGIKPDQLRQLFSHFDEYRDRITNFRISTKPVPLNNEIIEILKANKVTVIELGIPTFNNKIISKLNRRHSVEDLFTAYKALTGEGFHVVLQFMAGLPEETMADIETTVQHMITLKPYYIRIYPLVVFAATPLAEMYTKGLFIPAPFDTVLDRVVYMYLNALRKGIPVVKMGLTDNEVIKENIVAGHYRPAYGYMVKSRAFYLAVMARLRALSVMGRGDVVVHLNNRDIPHLIGYKRMNIARFAEEGVSIQWEKEGIDQDNFILHYDSRSIAGNIFDALEMLG
jgi:histone acetyltransferase (RNA polymerase elongator complex component)